MSSEYAAGYAAAVEAIAASQCTHCKLGVRVVKDELGFGHPWTRSGVVLRCWASAVREAAQRHEGVGAGGSAAELGPLR